MQFRALAIAAAALVASQAQAITLPAGTKSLYVSGSSALTPVIRAIFATNCSGGVSEYKNGAGDQLLFTCTLNNASTLATKLGTTTGTNTIALFKRDAGGSAQGVIPVAKQTAIAFINEASLTATGTNTGATTKNVVPDLGAADLEPAIFQESVNLGSNTALTPAQLANLNTFPALLQTFGIAVNSVLYTALQSAQSLSGTQVPSIPTSFIQSLVNFGGVANSSDKSWGYLLGNTNLGQINICRRTAGSGTQAGANLLFSPFQEVPLGAGASDATAVGNTGIQFISEGGSTGAVKTCLNNADLSTDADVYAIGYIGFENKQNLDSTKGTVDTWKFVKLDGYEATIANAQAGLYSYAFESTFNYNKALTGAAKQFADAIITETANPAVVSNLSADLRTAVVPVASSTATRAGNSRNPLKVVK
jgi:hypothetical protein